MDYEEETRARMGYVRSRDPQRPWVPAPLRIPFAAFGWTNLREQPLLTLAALARLLGLSRVEEALVERAANKLAERCGPADSSRGLSLQGAAVVPADGFSELTVYFPHRRGEVPLSRRSGSGRHHPGSPYRENNAGGTAAGPYSPGTHLAEGLARQAEAVGHQPRHGCRSPITSAASRGQ